METFDTQRPVPGRTARRFLIGTGVALVLFGAVALVVGGLRSPRLEPGSPEEAAANFTSAVLSHNYGVAYAQLSPDRQTECAPTSFPTWWGDRSTAVVVDSVVVRGDEVTVWLQVETLDPFDFPLDPFPDYYDETAWVSVERLDGEWRVTDASYLLLDCARSL